MTWTTAQEKRLIELHKRDLSQSQIGKILGKTRNAVGGKIARLKQDGVIKSSSPARKWSDVELLALLRAHDIATVGEFAKRRLRPVGDCRAKVQEIYADLAKSEAA